MSLGTSNKSQSTGTNKRPARSLIVMKQYEKYLLFGQKQDCKEV